MSPRDTGIGSTWAGTYEFQAAQLVEASSVDDVRAAVTNARGRVRALGTRHSFHDLADTDGTLVTVTGLDLEPVLDEEASTVEVGAGIRYGELAVWLESQGRALHNMGSLPHISIAGAVATGTHGSGVTNGCLSDAVAAIEYVDARGELVRVARGDASFEGLVVGLGAYGIVTRLALDVQPTYQVRQDIYRGIPWDAFLDDVRAVMGAAYSVSVFTTWDEPTLEQVWRKSRISIDIEPPDTWLGGQRAATSDARLVDSDPAFLTVQGGQAGPWLERLPHFRLEATPSNGDEIQTEYFVALDDAAAALRAVRTLGAAIAPHLLVTELRTVAADRLWLSGAYDRDTLAIHFTWRNEPEAVRQHTPRIEAALAPFVPRPHWGKVHTMSADAVAAAHPRLADARDLFESLDPDGKFSNAHVERLGVRTARS